MAVMMTAKAILGKNITDKRPMTPDRTRSLPLMRCVFSHDNSEDRVQGVRMPSIKFCLILPKIFPINRNNNESPAAAHFNGAFVEKLPPS